MSDLVARDIEGRVVEPGDRIYYPVRAGSWMALHSGRVENITWRKAKRWDRVARANIDIEVPTYHVRGGNPDKKRLTPVTSYDRVIRA